MRKYIGTKMIEAIPAIKVDGKVYEDRADSCIPNGGKFEYGYKVRYADGYESFSPADVFEKAYLPLEINENLKTDKPSISNQMVDRFIARFYATTVGNKTTMVRAVLVNGFEIVESSSCVSEENYDEEIGISICIDKIKDKVWGLLGFLLQTAVSGVNYETRYPSILHEEMKGSLDGEDEEALPYSDLPDPEPCEEDCHCCDEEPLIQTPYGPAVPKATPYGGSECTKHWPNCPVEKDCDSCETSEDGCECKPDAEDSGKCADMVEILIVGKGEYTDFDIQGRSDKVVNTLITALTEVFPHCRDKELPAALSLNLMLEDIRRRCMDNLFAADCEKAKKKETDCKEPENMASEE